MKSRCKHVATWGAAVLLLSAAVVAPGPTERPEPSGDPRWLPAAASTDVPVRVGTFNVRGVRHDLEPHPNEEPWRVRRAAIVRDILAEGLDVVGIQEASMNVQYAARMEDGPTQYHDLMHGLNDAGGSYALTNEWGYNCVRDWTPSKCVYQYRGASRDTRILYDTEALELVRQGSHEYDHQSGGANDQRFLSWAVFRIRESGAEFFFATTHLANRSAYLQKAQWRELLAEVEQLHGDLPVVVGGDFQTSKKAGTPAATMMTVMRKAGFNDVLNQRPDTPLVKVRRAEVTKHAWVNSKNGFDRRLARYSFENKRRNLGYGIDWIFASNHLQVRRYRVVVRFDPDTLRLKGVIPSDHFLVTARILIP